MQKKRIVFGISPVFSISDYKFLLVLNNMSWSGYIAWKIITATKRSFGSFIIRLSTVATAVSVTAMLITLCLINGFQQTISEKVFHFWGHIHVQTFDQNHTVITEEEPFAAQREIEQSIRSINGVTHIQPFATKGAIIKKDEQFSGVLLKGIDRHFNWKNFQAIMVAGHGIDFSDSLYSRQLIISKQMSSNLNVQVNDSVLIYFLRDGSNIQYRKVAVAGIYKTDIEEYDQNFALIDMRLLRKMNLWDSTQIGGYEIWVKDLDQLDTINTKIFEQLPDGLSSATIQQRYPNIFDWLNVQHQTKWIVIIIMGIVATINLITCLLILVLERTKMIGLLQALGAPNRSIQKIFLWYASYISMIGVAMGSIIGIGFCWAEYHFHFLKMDASTYYVSYAPVAFNWFQISLVLIGTVLICFLSLILPSFLINKIRPVKALQFK